jgi:hypothetical protein
MVGKISLSWFLQISSNEAGVKKGLINFVVKLAKTTPWLLSHRERISAKVSGEVAGWQSIQR